MQKMIEIFKALSNETRLKIYLFLLQKKLCVNELMNLLEMEQSRISHSLKILRKSGLIDFHRDGKWILYHANSNFVGNKILNSIAESVELSPEDLMALESLSCIHGSHNRK